MLNRRREKIKNPQAKQHRVESSEPFQSPNPLQWSFKLHTQKSVVSSDSEDSNASENPPQGFTCAQNPNDDLGDDPKQSNKPLAPSAATAKSIAKPAPQLVFIKQAAPPQQQNKPLVSPEKPPRQVSCDKDLHLKNLDNHSPIKMEFDKDMGKNLSPLHNILGNSASQHTEAEHDNERVSLGNSDYLTPNEEG